MIVINILVVKNFMKLNRIVMMVIIYMLVVENFKK